MKTRKVKLTDIEEKQVFDYIKSYQSKKPTLKPVVLTFRGDVFGELHFWR